MEHIWNLVLHALWTWTCALNAFHLKHSFLFKLIFSLIIFSAQRSHAVHEYAVVFNWSFMRAWTFHVILFCFLHSLMFHNNLTVQKWKTAPEIVGILISFFFWVAVCGCDMKFSLYFIFVCFFFSPCVLFQVSWVRRKGDELNLITFGRHTYSSDSRYSLEYVAPNNWQLLIQYANERDEGHYECQISSHPPLILLVYLTVVGK